ncbi:uncharacterized protein LOC130450456, partial [Diorhabda sublineata]|uniref:uncharacterized protein LOC130450456 n=1 Tax=Diorhabda sublineata TaxID=1163346 RepID=UPI0024E0FD27
LQIDKCEFLRKEVAYLGHIVTPEGVKPNPDKILAIQKFPIPKNSKQLKGFLGLLGYYRKFIKDFSKLTKPLTIRLKKDAIINVNDSDYVECFEMCKNMLMNEPILQYPDFTKPFNLTTDASNYALGAVLSQGKIGSDLPVAYASRTLNDSECNYSVIEKELLTIVWATKYFRPYLFGRKFTIVTDHKPLQWLFSLKDPSSKLVRWRLKLEEYDYDIVYKKGALNTNSDCLSRIQININETELQEPQCSKKLLVYMDKFNKKLSSTPDDNVSLIVETDNESNNNENDDEDITVHTNEENPVIGIPISDSAINVGKNQLIFSEVNFEPAVPTIMKLYENKQRIVVQLSKNNFEQDVINFVKEYIVPKTKYFIYFEDPIYEKFSVVLQNHFQDSQIEFTVITNLNKKNGKRNDTQRWKQIRAEGESDEEERRHGMGDFQIMIKKMDESKEREMNTNSQRMEEKIEDMRKQLEEVRSYAENKIQETKQEIPDEMLGRLMEGKEFNLQVLIAPDIETEIIIGYDELEKHKAIIDIEERRLKLDGTWINFEIIALNEEGKVVNNMYKEELKKNYDDEEEGEDEENRIAKDYVHKIEVNEDIKNFKAKTYPIPYKYKDQVRKCIKELLENKIIERSNSQYINPIVVILKKNGELRLCLDARNIKKN